MCYQEFMVLLCGVCTYYPCPVGSMAYVVLQPRSQARERPGNYRLVVFQPSCMSLFNQSEGNIDFVP